MTYYPNDYWEKRLSERFCLSGVGHIGFSEFYNKWLYKAKVRALKKALKSLDIDVHNKKICDIGSGTGFWVDFYKGQGARSITGIDITSVSIERLKQKYPKYHFIQGDISSPTLLSKINFEFDILNAFDVLYHITDDSDFKQAISNISKLTKTNGFIVISDLFGLRDNTIAKHVKVRSKNTYELILEKCGAKVISVYPLYYLLNKEIFASLENVFFKKIIRKLDNLFSPIYFYLDGILLSSRRNNLNLIIAKKMNL